MTETSCQVSTRPSSGRSGRGRRRRVGGDLRGPVVAVAEQGHTADHSHHGDDRGGRRERRTATADARTPAGGRRQAGRVGSVVAGGAQGAGQAVLEVSCLGGPVIRSCDLRRLGPEVHAGVDGVLVDLGQLVVGQRREVERVEVGVELLDRRGPDHGRGDPRVAQRPLEGELRELLPAPLGDLVQRPDAVEHLLVEPGDGGALARGPRVLGDALEVAVGQQPLRQRGEDDAAHALPLELVEEVGLDPAVQHRVRRLVDQQRRPEVAGDVAACSVFSAEYDEMPAYSARPDRTAVSSAIIVSSTGVSGSKRWL